METHEKLVQFCQTKLRWPKFSQNNFSTPEAKLARFRSTLGNSVQISGIRLRVAIAEGTLKPLQIEKLRDQLVLSGLAELYGVIERIPVEEDGDQSAPRTLLEDKWTPNINRDGDRLGRGVLGCVCGQRHPLVEYSQYFMMQCISCAKSCKVVPGCAGFDQTQAHLRVVEGGDGESYSTWQCSDCYCLDEASGEEAGGCICGKNFSHGDIDHWLECEKCGWLHLSGNCVNFDEAESEDNWVCGFCD